MRDLREQGSVTALAFNDPKRLDELQPPPVNGEGEPAAVGRGWDSED